MTVRTSLLLSNDIETRTKARKSRNRGLSGLLDDAVNFFNGQTRGTGVTPKGLCINRFLRPDHPQLYSID